jgi:transposase InsO family protein
MGSVGDCFGNAVIESFCRLVQVERLDGGLEHPGGIVELANAIFEYLEIFHSRERRYSPLSMLTPVEF